MNDGNLSSETISLCIFFYSYIWNLEVGWLLRNEDWNAIMQISNV